jgi:sorbitol-specific phosphotransferase system component IIA
MLEHKQHGFNGEKNTLCPGAIVVSGDGDKFTLIKFTTVIIIHERER